MIWYTYGFIVLVCAGTVIWASAHKKKIDRQDRAAVRDMLDYIERNYP